MAKQKGKGGAGGKAGGSNASSNALLLGVAAAVAFVAVLYLQHPGKLVYAFVPLFVTDMCDFWVACRAI